MATRRIASVCKRVLRFLVRRAGRLARRVRWPVDPLRYRVPVWQTMPHLQGRCGQVPSTLSNEESNLLYWLARDRYTGRGTIVDYGSFLGASTLALCSGLRDNPGTFPKAGLVHSFDPFRYDLFFEPWFKPFGETLAEGDDFSHLFRRLTAPYQDLIEVHRGDMLAATYADGPIEVLFLDCCNSWERNAAVVNRFFRHLIPGRSVVVQQDYLQHHAPWLVVTMDFFRHYFEYRCRVTTGSSAVFRCVRRIPEQLLSVDLKALPHMHKQAAFERALERVEGWARVELLVGYAYTLVEEKDFLGAAAVIRRIDRAFEDHPLNQNAFRFLESLYPYLEVRAA